MEEWKQHPIYSKIEVSTLGRVRNTSTKTIKKLSIRRTAGGYLVTSVGGTRSPIKRVCRLVLETFYGMEHFTNDGKCLEARHLNGNPTDDRLSNLKWGTRREQVFDQKRHGTFVPPPILTGWENPAKRHSDEAYRRAFVMINSGLSVRETARRTGISKSQLLRRRRACGTN